MLRNTDLHWIAGFLEGEGSFGWNKASRRIAVRASQVQREPLERLQCFLGGGIYSHKEGHPRPIFVWVANEPAGLCMTLFSLMSPRRKQQIATCLERWRAQQVSNKFKTKCIRGHAFTPENTYPKPNGRGRECKACWKVNRASA